MKGTMICCMKEMVTEKFGIDAWRNTLEKSGLERNMVFLAMDDIPDAKVVEVISNLCNELNVTLDQAADVFGEYFATVYAPRVYGGFFIGVENAKDFLLRMNTVHEVTTKTIKNATPPMFYYEDKGKSLIMTYESKRNLVPIFKGLVKGVGKYFKEELQVKSISPNRVEIIFP